MFTLFNIIVIGLVLLIAYWWADQGLFSSLLHLLCVIIAGAATLAFWEPLSMLLLRGSMFDGFSWGVSFLSLFTATLFILRIILDKLAPANVSLPAWANVIFGGSIGFCSGVLTIGMLVLGLGFFQSTADLMAFRGFQRAKRNGEVTHINQLWLPVHSLTTTFYSSLSRSSLKTQRPLHAYYPDLDKQSTLIRDSYNSGQGQISMHPRGVNVKATYRGTEGGKDRFIVLVSFSKEALDWGNRLTLTASQVRLIGEDRSSGDSTTYHPVGWHNRWSARRAYYSFDSIAAVASSEPGQSTTEHAFNFLVPQGTAFTPRFIQIRGTRFDLGRTPPEALTDSHLAQISSAGSLTTAMQTIEVIPGGVPIQDAIELYKAVRGLRVSINMLPASISEHDRWLISGSAEFRSGELSISRKLLIQGILEEEGTQIVQVDVGWQSPANIFKYMEIVRDDAKVLLHDAAGNSYLPIGYVLRQGSVFTIKLDRVNRIASIEDMPIPSRTSSDLYKMIFAVTRGNTLTGLTFGDVTVGSCNIDIPLAP